MLSRAMVILATLLAALPAAAETVWVGGLSGAGQTRVGYLGRVAPLPGQRLGDGWGYVLAADRVHYEYNAAAAQVDGEASSLKASVFRDIRLATGTLTFGLGGAYQHVTLSPQDPNNRAAGTHPRATTEAQWRSHAQLSWASQMYAQYIHGADSHFASGFLGRRLGNGLALGAQASSGGDPTYRAHGLAIALRGMKHGASEWSIYAGGQHQEGRGTEPELGISFVSYRP